MPSFHTRRLISSDLENAYILRMESIKNSSSNFLPTYDEELALAKSFLKQTLHLNESNHFIFGAFLNKELIGMTGIFKKNFEKIKHKCHVWGTYVKPDFRGSSVGKSLIRSVILHAKNEMCCTTICLSVVANNIPAIKLYESCGFKIWGKEENAIVIDGKYFAEYHAALQIA